MGHRYGGPWSDIKVAAVEYYLKCFTAALTPRNMNLWYFDAFAGSGDREQERQIGGLLDGGRPYETIVETTDGSARKALAVEPPFKHFVFIEKDPERVSDLEALKSEFADRHIEVRAGDANAELLHIAARPPWIRQARSWDRGVVFLDPYALHVEWETLLALAHTKSLDVWYLFPIRDVTRQLARKFSGVGPKEARLDAVLGKEWRELYSPIVTTDAPQSTLFPLLDGDVSTTEEMKRIDEWRQIEAWFKRRLEGPFSYVSDPLPILTHQRRQSFSLFLAVSNPKPAAVSLAKDFVKYVQKNFGSSASHHRSGR